jgi:hypothetical protein
MDPRYKLYMDFTNAFVAAHANLKKEIAYKQAQQEWTDVKIKPVPEIELCIQTLRAKVAEKKGSLLTMWARAAVRKSSVADETQSAIPSTSLFASQTVEASDADCQIWPVNRWG